MADEGKAKAMFRQQSKARIAELEVAFKHAIKENKFQDALRFARTVIELDPTTTKYDEFIPLLEEKVADDEETAGSMGSDDEEAEANAEANDAGESEDGEEDEEEEEEGNEDEEDDDEEGEEEDEAGPPAPPQADSITLNGDNMNISKAERIKMREGLAASIQELKEKEIMEKLAANDPLLGA
mmetsp:Transcript_12094/g.35608  ORF Transcript_12094/g.35608 Transcript_12094/m.35608 type:complete len:183 (-) Transcript_12094:476-1024(-)